MVPPAARGEARAWRAALGGGGGASTSRLRGHLGHAGGGRGACSAPLTAAAQSGRPAKLRRCERRGHRELKLSPGGSVPCENFASLPREGRLSLGSELRLRARHRRRRARPLPLRRGRGGGATAWTSQIDTC